MTTKYEGTAYTNDKEKYADKWMEFFKTKFKYAKFTDEELSEFRKGLILMNEEDGLRLTRTLFFLSNKSNESLEKSKAFWGPMKSRISGVKSLLSRKKPLSPSRGGKRKNNRKKTIKRRKCV
jgi:hypothetical protein